MRSLEERNADILWWDKYGSGLERLVQEREEFLRKGRTLELDDVAIIADLQDSLCLYWNAETERPAELLIHSFRQTLTEAQQVVEELTDVLQVRTAEQTRNVGRTLRQLSKCAAEEQTIQDISAACTSYRNLRQFSERIIPVSQVKGFYVELAELCSRQENSYDLVLQQYTAATSVKELETVQAAVEQTLLPFRRKQEELRQKYSWSYTFRFLPCLGEYKIIDRLELPGRWKELAAELNLALQDPAKILQKKTELAEKTEGLGHVYDSLARVEATVEYITRLQAAREKIQRDSGQDSSLSLDGAALYLKEAVEGYRKAHARLEKHFAEVEERLPFLFSEELRVIEDGQATEGGQEGSGYQTYQTKEEVQEALAEVAALEQKAAAISSTGTGFNGISSNGIGREILPPNGISRENGIGREITAVKHKLEKAAQAYQYFSSPAELETAVVTRIRQEGWPPEQEMEQRVAWALISGRNYHHQPISGDIWQRTAALGVRERQMVDLLAVAYDAGLVPTVAEGKTT